MPVISKVLTPMRLFAMPRRTPRFGSLCFAKSSLSAEARPSMSRSSPPTTTPSGRSIRATCSSCGDPFEFETRAAAICDAPIFSPTSPPLPCVGAFCFFGALGAFSPFARLAFGALTACSPAASLFLPNESSRFQNGGCFSFGCSWLALCGDCSA